MIKFSWKKIKYRWNFFLFCWVYFNICSVIVLHFVLSKNIKVYTNFYDAFLFLWVIFKAFIKLFTTHLFEIINIKTSILSPTSLYLGGPNSTWQTQFPVFDNINWIQRKINYVKISSFIELEENIICKQGWGKEGEEKSGPSLKCFQKFC